MIIKRLKYFILPLCFISLTFGQELTLNNAVDIALKNNPKIKQYKEKLAQKEFDDLSALGNFLPKINLEGSYTHLNDKLEIDLSPIRDGIIQLQAGTQTEIANLKNMIETGSALSPEARLNLQNQFTSNLNSLLPSFSETLKDQNFKTATITAVQPLFLGGKLIAGKNYADAEKNAAASELTKIKNDVTNEVINNYLNVLLLRNVVATRHDVLSGMKKHEHQANRLLKEGVIANYQALRAKVAVSEAEINLTDDENKLELAKSALKNALGLDESAMITLKDTLAFTDYAVKMDTVINKAYSDQPVLRMLQFKKKAADQKFAAARANFLPQLAAFGKYEMYPEYLSVLEPRWAIGLNVRFNIFNGLKDYMDLQSAEHLQNEVKYIQAETKRKINLWVNKSYKDMVNAKTQYKKLNAALDLAEESLRMNEKRFNTGLGTSLEVIDARLSLEKIEIQRLVSIKNYYQSMSNLYLAAGDPTVILKFWNKPEIN